MENSTVSKVSKLKDECVSPLCTIWIVYEEQDDSFDISVWDEIENERDEEIEESRFGTLEEAEKALNRIVLENPEISFVRLLNEKTKN